MQLRGRVAGARRRSHRRRRGRHGARRRRGRPHPHLLHGLQCAEAPLSRAVPPLRSRPAGHVHRRGRRVRGAGRARAGARPRRQDLRHARGPRDDDGRLPRDLAPSGGRGHGTGHGSGARERAHRPRGRGLRERARHGHAAERSDRGPRDPRGIRPGAAPGELDEVHDRPHHGGGGCPRGGRDHPRAGPRGGPADGEPRDARPRRGVRLRAARGPRGRGRVRDLELLRLRWAERDAALRAGLAMARVAVTGVGVVTGAVMNTMAAATAIAVTARELSLTLNAPTVAGELAIARAAAAVRAGRADAVLAGGVDEFDSALAELLAEGGAPSERRGEGAGFVLLESLDTAEARGARVLGEIAGVAWRALRARPYGVGRGAASRAIAAALDEAGATSDEVGRVWVSASGDGPRDRWEQAILEEALRPARPPQTALASRAGRHAGLGALAVAAAALDEVSRGPAVVHAIARGGTHVALVVRRAPVE